MMKLCQTGSFGVLNVPSLLLNCCYRKWPIWAVTQASISAEAVWGLFAAVGAAIENKPRVGSDQAELLVTS